MKVAALVRLIPLTFALGTLACGDDDDGPVVPAAEVFHASLDGASERPTPRTTPATGTADFTFRRDTLYWVINLSNITNVTASHIHIGTADVAGGILLLLSTPASNTQMSGFMTSAAFPAPSSPNQAVTFANLLDLMRTGGTYVNVHTNNTANDPTNNTGPGDFPGGEVRGQIAKTS